MAGRLRITQLVDSPTSGGAETHVAQLQQFLPTGHEVSVVSTEPVADVLARGGEVITAPLDHIAAAAAATEPDVVHAHLIDPAANQGLIDAAAAVPGAVSVATCHMTGTFGTDRDGLVRSYRKLDGAIAVSAEVAALLGGLGARRVRVVVNGVAPMAPRPLPSRQPLVIAALGRLTLQKGFDVLVEAVARLVGEGYDIVARIAGEGRERDRLAAATRRLPVELVGHVGHVEAHLAAADVFCLPSRAEGLPLALLEAMMLGRPCIATDVGHVRAAVGDAVELVPAEAPDVLARTLADLLADGDRRRELGARAATLAHTGFDVRRTAREVAAFYAHLRSLPSRGGPLS